MNEKYPQDGQISGDQFFSSFSGAHPVRELGLELGDLKVDLVQVLVHKSHQALLHHLGKVKIIAKVFKQDVKQNKTKSQKYCFYLSLAHICKRKEHNV